MKKVYIFFSLFVIINYFGYANNRFYLQNRLGALIKVDPASAYKAKYAEKKGPTIYEIPKEMTLKEMEENYFKTVTPSEYELLITSYKKNSNKYSLTLTFNAFDELTKIKSIFILNRVKISSLAKISLNKFEKRIMARVKNKADKEYLLSKYKKNGKFYFLDINWQEIGYLERLRALFLKYNTQNEIYTGLDQYGSPMPHNFARVHEAKSRAHFDMHFAWGVRLENNLTIGFAFNITNFTMFSLELLTIKYNFNIPDAPFEPFIGGALYGGYADGFPIGINMLGGVDIFPLSHEANAFEDNRNFFLTTEVRIGPVIYVPVYYDTGLNNETIYKKLGVLLDGGLYFGYGYIFD